MLPQEDFELEADWIFFASRHGKSPCDGLGGTVKQFTTRASLQRPLRDQIVNVDAVFVFYKESVPVIHSKT